MDFTKILKPFDDKLKYLNDNKNVLLFVLILVGIYTVHFNESMTSRGIELYSNNIFKLIIFVIVSYMSSSSPALGISLAIMILISFQIITNIKLKQELGINKFEKFSEIKPSDTTYFSNEFLTNPIGRMNGPLIPVDLKLTSPTDISMQMLKEGKILLDDSQQLENNLKSRYDSREQDIMNITKKKGHEMIQSGLNRMQQSNMGDYLNTNPSTNIKFIKYDRMIKNNSNDYGIKATYAELINNYQNLLLMNKMKKTEQTNQNIDEIMKKININQFELLERIYNNSKNEIDIDKQKMIEDQINLIKQLKSEGQRWTEQLSNLIILID